MPQYVKVGGTWSQVDETANCGYIKVGGTWRTVTDSYVKVAGTWRNVCVPVPTTTTTTTTTTTAAPTTATTTTAATTATTTTTTTTTTAAPPFFPFFPPTPVIPSFTSNPTVTNISNSGGTLNWASVNQYSYVISAAGTALDGATGFSATQRLFTGLSAGTTYSYQVTITSSTGHTATAPVPAGSFTTTGGTTTTTTTAATTTTTTTAAPCTVGASCGSGYTCYPEGFYTNYTLNAACNCVLENGFC